MERGEKKNPDLLSCSFPGNERLQGGMNQKKKKKGGGGAWEKIGCRANR